MPTKATAAAKLSGLKHSISETVSAYNTMADHAEERSEERVEAFVDEHMDTSTPFRKGVAKQVGSVLTVVTLGLSIILGILVYSQVQTALPTPQNSELKNASDNSTGTFADSMELAPVIMIVLLASVILAVIQRFRG